MKHKNYSKEGLFWFCKSDFTNQWWQAREICFWWC